MRRAMTDGRNCGQRNLTIASLIEILVVAVVARPLRLRSSIRIFRIRIASDVVPRSTGVLLPLCMDGARLGSGISLPIG